MVLPHRIKFLRIEETVGDKPDNDALSGMVKCQCGIVHDYDDRDGDGIEYVFHVLIETQKKHEENQNAKETNANAESGTGNNAGQE